MKEVVFLNGKFVSSDQIKPPLLEPGFLDTYGLFETMRSYKNNIVYFDQHLKRLFNSCGLIGINPEYSSGKIKNLIRQAIKLSAASDCYIRLTVWKKSKTSGTMIVAREHHPRSPREYQRGFRACVSPLRNGGPASLVNIKTCNRIFYEFSYQKARENHFQEAVILTDKGLIAEASRSNIFFAKNNELFTPSLDCLCLNGITRRVVLDLAKKYNIAGNQGKFTTEDLYQMQEAFLTNSLNGIMPLVSLEGRPISIGRAGKLTRFLMGKYRALLQSGPCRRV